MPRFKIEPAQSFDLSKVLETELGMTLAFDREKANFSGMATARGPNAGLYIAKVYHKTYVSVDEAGTEAAAATAVSMSVRGAPSQRPVEPTSFVADHPFLFLIRDTKTGLVMFLGRIQDLSRG